MASPDYLAVTLARVHALALAAMAGLPRPFVDPRRPRDGPSPARVQRPLPPPAAATPAVAGFTADELVKLARLPPRVLTALLRVVERLPDGGDAHGPSV